MKKQDSWFESLGHKLTGWMSPRPAQDQEAAVKVQTAARTHLARKKVRYLKTMRRLVQVMANRERKCATLIQTTWRDHHARTSPEGQAAAKVQAVVRGQRDRGRVEQTKKVEQFAENHAAKVIQRHTIAAQDKIKMLKECVDVLEKQGRKLTLAKWEMVVWQERFVQVTAEGLVYRHLDSKGEPKGKEKAVPFSSMEMIKALLGDILYIKCTRREYHFQCAGPVECERWATNLVLLAQYSGYTVPGYVVMAPDADDDKPPPEVASADVEGETGYADNYGATAADP